MPIREYVCHSCGAAIERLERTGERLEACDKCHSTEVERVMSAGAFQLVGSGWARDGYSRPPPQKPV